MEFTFPRMDYHQQPTLARHAFRRSTASSMFLYTLLKPKLPKTCLVCIHRWICCWSSYGFSCSSTVYPAAMLMSTIHPLSGDDLQVLSMRKHPGNKSTNASVANSTVLPAECQTELDILVIVDIYNKHKVDVYVADWYQTNCIHS